MSHKTVVSSVCVIVVLLTECFDKGSVSFRKVAHLLGSLRTHAAPFVYLYLFPAPRVVLCLVHFVWLCVLCRQAVDERVS